MTGVGRWCEDRTRFKAACSFVPGLVSTALACLRICLKWASRCEVSVFEAPLLISGVLAPRYRDCLFPHSTALLGDIPLNPEWSHRSWLCQPREGVPRLQNLSCRRKAANHHGSSLSTRCHEEYRWRFFGSKPAEGMCCVDRSHQRHHGLPLLRQEAQRWEIWLR